MPFLRLRARSPTYAIAHAAHHDGTPGCSQLGDSSNWRKASILADCVVKLACESDEFSGNMLIDDEYLRKRHGFTDADLVQVPRALKLSLPSATTCALLPDIAHVLA